MLKPRGPSDSHSISCMVPGNAMRRTLMLAGGDSGVCMPWSNTSSITRPLPRRQSSLVAAIMGSRLAILSDAPDIGTASVTSRLHSSLSRMPGVGAELPSRKSQLPAAVAGNAPGPDSQSDMPSPTAADPGMKWRVHSEISRFSRPSNQSRSRLSGATAARIGARVTTACSYRQASQIVSPPVAVPGDGFSRQTAMTEADESIAVVWKEIDLDQ
jgi:hypothetical protein